MSRGRGLASRTGVPTSALLTGSPHSPLFPRIGLAWQCIVKNTRGVSVVGSPGCGLLGANGGSNGGSGSNLGRLQALWERLLGLHPASPSPS